VYGGATVADKSILSSGPKRLDARASNTPDSSLTSTSLHVGTFPGASDASAEFPVISDTRDLSVSSNNHQLFDLSTQTLSPIEGFTFDQFLTFDDDTPDQLLNLHGNPVGPNNKSDYRLSSWCSWPRAGVSHLVVTDNPTVELDSGLLAILRMERPHAQHSANFVIQSLRSFPTMMLRKETFPWFIHTQSQLLSKPAKAVLPEALSTCMSIAQIFAARTSETKPFLWGTIRAEYRRFRNEVCLHIMI
jgi:hypothetical protein